MLFKVITFFGCNVLNVNPLKYLSINTEVCRARPEAISFNSNEPWFYTYSIKIGKCCGSWIYNNQKYWWL